MNGYLSVKGWSNFQHYKDRNPPWIKLHRDLLNNYEFTCLQDASKAHLMLIWLLASQLDNKIPNDAKWIANRIGCSNQINLKSLIDSGFLISDSMVLAKCKQSAVTETETETDKRQNKSIGQNEFDRWWACYPKKVGKKPALAIWKRIKPNADGLIYDVKQRMEQDAQWLEGYIPNPTTYLNQERWNDELQADKPKPNGFKQPEVKSQSFKTFDPNAVTEIPAGQHPYEGMT